MPDSGWLLKIPHAFGEFSLQTIAINYKYLLCDSHVTAIFKLNDIIRDFGIRISPCLFRNLCPGIP